MDNQYVRNKLSIKLNLIMRQGKKTEGVVDEKVKTDLQLWYLHDKGLSTQNEIVELLLTLE